MNVFICLFEKMKMKNENSGKNIVSFMLVLNLTQVHMPQHLTAQLATCVWKLYDVIYMPKKGLIGCDMLVRSLGLLVSH